MSLKSFERRAIIFIALLAVGSMSHASGPRYLRLTILHTNDTHSHLLPFSYPSSRPGLPFHKNIGGIARRATLVRRIRAEQQPTILMDAGDLIDGSMFSVEFAGEADFAAANAAGYEVMVTGNHEYSNHFADLNKRLHEAQFPVLGANVYRKADGSVFLTPYMMKIVDGIRIAILGLVLPNNYTAVSEGKLEIKDPMEVAREWVPKLRQQADVVILLTHIGYEEDRKLAEQVPGIDAIIGGHTHTRLEKPVLVRRDPLPHAFWIGGTVIAQDFQWGGDLGECNLIFHKGDSGWSLMSYTGRLIPITSDIPEDRYVRDVVEKYHKKIAAKYDVVLGTAAADFVGEARMNIVSDALRESFSADFAVHNYGGVRTDLVQGPITAGDIAAFFPFEDETLTFQATGAQVKEFLRTGTPAVSNIRYRIESGKLVFAELGGKPIEDAHVYKGVTHSFHASNSFPKEIRTTDMGIGARDVVMNYIKAKKTISPDPVRRAEF